MKLLTNKKTIVILIILIFVVAVLYIYRASTPEIPTISNPIANPNYVANTHGTIAYTGPIITPPESLNTYQNTAPSLTQSTKQIANQLGLLVTDFDENAYTQGQTHLYADLNTQTTTYADTTVSQRDITGVDTQKSLSVAQDFINTIGINKNTNPNPIQTNFHKSALEPTPASPDQANMAEFVFQQQIDQIPLAVDTFPNSTIQVYVTNNSFVSKAAFPPLITPIILQQNLPTIPFQQVLQLLSQGKGNIALIKNNNGVVTQTTNLQDITLSQARLQYRLYQQRGEIYPYYQFTGTSTTDKGEQVSLNIILPAVEI